MSNNPPVIPVDPAVEEVRRRIRRRPARPWLLPPATAPGLAFEVDMRTSPDRAEELYEFTQRCPYLDASQLTSTVISVVQGLDRQRIALQGAGAFGSDAVFLSHIDQGALYLDRRTNTFLQMEPGQLAGASFGAVTQLTWSIVSGHPSAATPVTVELIATAPRPSRYRISFDPAPQWQPYARAVLALLLGSPERAGQMGVPFDALAPFGIPVHGELFFDGNGASPDTPLSTFQLRAITLRPITPDEFAIPPGARDLRDGPVRQAHTSRRTSRPTPGYAARRGGAGPRRLPSAGLVGSSGPARAPSAPIQNDFLPTTDNLQVPQCLASTYGALLSLSVHQSLADDVRTLVNEIARRLALPTHGDNGKLVIPWFQEFQAYSASKTDPDPKKAGDIVFCVLHEDPGPDPMTEPGGRGLLDRYAQRLLEGALIDGKLPDKLMLDPGLDMEVKKVIAANAPMDRLGALQPDSRLELRKQFLLQVVGTFTLDNLPNSWGPDPILYDLLRIGMSDLSLDFTIANQPDDLTRPLDDSVAFLRSLVLGDGTIDLEFHARNLEGEAWIYHFPSALYASLVVFGPLLCIFVPFICTLLPIVSSIGAFLLLDVARLHVRFPDLRGKVHVQFAPVFGDPDLPDGSLAPTATLTLDSGLEVTYTSVIPDGLHQIFDALIADVASRMVEVRQGIASLASGAITQALRDLKFVFPPQLGSVTVRSFTSQVRGLQDPAEGHIYLESSLNGGLTGISGPFITQVDRDVYQKLEAGRAAFAATWKTLKTPKGTALPPLTQYLDFVISANFLNLYVNGLWRNGHFNATLTPAFADTAFKRLLAAHPELKLVPPFQVHLWPAVSPRLVLTPRAEAEESGHSYMSAFFDDVRLCLEDNHDPDLQGNTIEIQFAAEVRSSIGFGAVDPATGQLDILKVTEDLLDVYFDLDRLGVSIITPEMQSVSVQGPGVAALDASLLPGIQDLLKMAMSEALSSRNDRVIPRGAATNPNTVLMYFPANQLLLIGITPQRGQLYCHLAFQNGLVGALTTPASCAAGKDLLNLLAPPSP